MIFAPLRIDAGTVVYIGDIEVKQRITWIDLMLDRVKMDYEIVDRYDETAADFRARYPQFQNVKIEKRLPAPIAVCE